MLAKADPRLRRLIGPAILILLALIPVWRAVVLGEAIGPVDHIRAMLDPAAPKPTTPWNVLQADSLLQFRTWRGLVFEGWSKGTIPTWNPYSLLGTPLLANSQSGALYPFHILAGVLRLDLDRAIGLLAWLHLSLAGIGTFRLCRALGTDRASALFGGSAFMLSAFLLAWTPLASVPTTVGWIPWALFWIARYPRSWRGGPWLAVCLAMMLLAGHLQFAVYGLIGAVVFALAQGAWRAAPAFALAGALAAAHLLPVLDFGQYSHRRTPPTAEGYAAYSKSAVQLWQLGTVAAPDAYGLPQKDGMKVGEAKLSSYWPSTVKLGENFAEAAVGLSPAVFVLLIVVPWRRREVWSIGLMALLGLLFAMPTALTQGLYSYVPGWSATGSPGRAVVLFVLGGSVLGALGFQRLRIPSGDSNDFDLRQVAIAGMTVLAIALTLELGTFAPANLLGLDPEILSIRRSEALLFAFLPAFGAVATLAILFLPAMPRRFVPFAALIPTIHALVTYAPGLIPTGLMPPLPTAPPGTRVAVVNDRWNLFTTPKAIVPPNLLAAARIVDTGGYDSLLDRETKAMLDRVNRAESPPPENGNMMFVKSTVDLDALRELGVGEVWAKVPIPGLEVLGETGGVFRHRLDGQLVRVSSESGAAKPHEILRFTPNGIHGAQGDADHIRLAWRNLPGWQNDGPTPRPSPFLDIAPFDRDEFTLTYVPPGLRPGLVVSAIGFVALLAWGLAPLLGSRFGRSPDANADVLL